MSLADQVAALEPPDTPPDGELVHRFRIGTLRCTALSDGYVEAPVQLLAPEVPLTEIQALLRANGQDVEKHRNPISCLFVTLEDGRSVIIDAGMGNAPGPDGRPNTTAGRFAEAVADAGIDPAGIHVVLVSHVHPDHVGGLFDDEGEPFFPNATYHVSRGEVDFWRTTDLAGTMMPPPKRAQVIETAHRFFERAGDRLRIFNAGEPVVAGVATMLLPGHTGGQVGFVFDGGAETLLYTADAVGHTSIALQRPEWRFAFDADTAVAIDTRRKLVALLVERGWYNFTPHFPWPSFGRVGDRDGTAVWTAG